MATRNVSLTQTLDEFVETQVASGEYQNASEVVRASLRLLKQQSDRDAAQLERLRAAVQAGRDEIAAGRFEEVTGETLDGWLDGVAAEAARI